jgi:hypothetical protein
LREKISDDDVTTLETIAENTPHDVSTEQMPALRSLYMKNGRRSRGRQQDARPDAAQR